MSEKVDPRVVLNPIKLSLEGVSLLRRLKGSEDKKLSDVVQAALRTVPKCDDQKAIANAARAWLERELAGKAVSTTVLAGALGAVKRAFSLSPTKSSVVAVEPDKMAASWEEVDKISARRSKRLSEVHAAKGTTPAKKKGAAAK